MFDILAATKNAHKIEEFKELLGAKDVTILSLLDFPDAPEVIEDGATFEENARKKATESSAFTGLATFADDSGLEVEALGGAPGIQSARYAGPNASNEERIKKLLDNMKGASSRKARFVCVIALANNGEVMETFTGEVKGTISEEPRGSNGFGYDPIFVPDGYTKTFAELDAEVKNKISHRARAVKAALEFIEDELSTVDGFDE
ncbi:MAG: non-canonical purine NTP pyrophosphatase, RdgB/HAM1 family [Lentisphaerae bacterium GWF2_45_14]|nr:MAG: non-canonical purine NTP pyrophosphatase, RdgB/HAM1 family [Lentisphaerae bacterium GWF2_45_14]